MSQPQFSTVFFHDLTKYYKTPYVLISTSKNFYWKKPNKSGENPSARPCFRLSRQRLIRWWSQIWWLLVMERSHFWLYKPPLMAKIPWIVSHRWLFVKTSQKVIRLKASWRRFFISNWMIKNQKSPHCLSVFSLSSSH